MTSSCFLLSAYLVHLTTNPEQDESILRRLLVAVHQESEAALTQMGLMVVVGWRLIVDWSCLATPGVDLEGVESVQ